MQHQGAPIPPAQLSKLGVTIPSAGLSAISYPLYDSAAYAAAGQNTLTFFQNPIGSNGKTLADTNMTLAGLIPAGNIFVVTGIAIRFTSGAAVETFGAPAAPDYVADVHAFYDGLTAGGTLKPGYAQLESGSTWYVRAPICDFPWQSRLNVQSSSSDASTAATDQFYAVAVADNAGIPYEISPIALPQGQQFSFTLNWPNGVVAMPSAKAGLVYCKLNGWLYRPPQA